MPIYAPHVETTPDISVGNDTRVLLPGVEAASSLSISIAVAGAAQNVHFTTPRWLINSDVWESGGNMSCKLRVTATSNMRVRCMIRRFGPNGALLQTGTFTGFQTPGAPSTVTFTPTVPTWTSADENCGNRLSIRFQFDALNAASAASITIEIGTVDTEITSTITENNGNCRRINIA